MIREQRPQSYNLPKMELRELPSVDELLRDELFAAEPRELVVESARTALARARLS